MPRSSPRPTPRKTIPKTTTAKKPTAKEPAAKKPAAKAKPAKAGARSAAKEATPAAIRAPARAAEADKASEAFTAAATEAAYLRVLPRMQALPAREVSRPTYHLQRAALAALQVLRYIETAKLVHCYEALAEAGLFDLSQLTGLRELAQAAWFTRAQLEGARGMASTQQVPLVLLDQAGQLRARMLRVLDFHFSDDPQVARELGAIRQGAGYNDLAADLLALARLYKQHHQAIAGTPRHYDKADERLAAKLADQILDYLDGGAGKSVEEWQDRQARVAVLFAGSYEEVCAVGRFLCRKDPGGMGHFPLLASAGRRSGESGKKKEEPEGGDKPTG
ncbi:MAG: hypothetical protein U1A78_21140 [Polyangia bacterium]